MTDFLTEGADSSRAMNTLGEIYKPLVMEYIEHLKTHTPDFRLIEERMPYQVDTLTIVRSHEIPKTIKPLHALAHYGLQYTECCRLITDTLNCWPFTGFNFPIISETPSIFEEAMRLVFSHNYLQNQEFANQRDYEITKFESEYADILSTAAMPNVRMQIDDTTATYIDVISLMIAPYGTEDPHNAITIFKGLINTPIVGPNRNLMSGVKNLFEVFTRASFGTLAETAHHANLRLVNLFELNTDNTISITNPGGLFRFIRNYNRTEELLFEDGNYVMRPKKNDPSGKFYNSHGQCPFANTGLIPDIANIWIRDLEAAIDYITTKQSKT